MDGGAADPVTELTYAGTHALYRQAGWSGVLPLPPGSKFPPPDGFTGYTGLDPSGADSQAWIDDFAEYRNTGQLALRMPATAIGIDVDHYKDKLGADTMREAMRRWGPLPVGAHSSARGDGSAGIWFFRVPKGATLKTRIAFPELGLGHVEIIQRHHRYACVWPSVHPETGQRYEWYGLGQTDLVIPRLVDLPPLPQGWLDGLAGADEPGVTAADPKTVAEFSKRYTASTEPGALRGALKVFADGALIRSRHDSMMDAACMAAREVRMGRYSAADAQMQLRGAFMETLTSRDGSAIAPGAARREFDSMWAWGVSQALALTDAELGERRERAQAGTAADPMTRPSQDNFWEDEGERPRPPGVAPSGAETAGGGVQGGYVTDVAGTVFTGDEEELTPEQLLEKQYQAELAAKVRALRMTAAAKEILADETREPLVTLGWAEFLAAPQPEYLVPDLLYRNGSAKVFGPPGSTKSFLVLDLALSLATGTPWHGITLGRSLVHYVMAEGQAINVGRTLAWLHHRGLDQDAAAGRFRAVPQGVLLTEQGIAQYLEVVRTEQPALIILDTKNRMMVGEENLASDSAVMIRAIDAIRQAAGGACVLLVDHTGVHDTTRGRGSNAVMAAMDTEIRVMCENGVATAEVTRDKDSDSGKKWHYRLQAVPAARRPGARHDPAVPVPLDEAPAAVLLLGPEQELWKLEIPEDVVQAVNGLAGAGVARDIYRLMRHVNSEDGLTAVDIRSAVEESPRGKVSKSTWQAGWALARKTAIAETHGGGSRRFVLGLKWHLDEA
jgi:hypothetical protein